MSKYFALISLKRLIVCAFLFGLVVLLVRYALNTHDEYAAYASAAKEAHAEAAERDGKLVDYLRWMCGARSDGPEDLTAELFRPQSAFRHELQAVSNSIVNAGSYESRLHLEEADARPEQNEPADSENLSRFTASKRKRVHKYKAVFTAPEHPTTGTNGAQEGSTAVGAVDVMDRFAAFANHLVSGVQSLESEDSSLESEPIDQVLARHFGLWDQLEGQYVVTSVFLVRSDGHRVRFPAVDSKLSKDFDLQSRVWWKECTASVAREPILSTIYDNRVEDADRLVRTFACMLDVPDPDYTWALGIDLHWNSERLPPVLITSTEGPPTTPPADEEPRRGRPMPVLSAPRLWKSMNPKSDYDYTGWGALIALGLAGVHFFNQMVRGGRRDRQEWHLERLNGFLGEFDPTEGATQSLSKEKTRQRKREQKLGASAGSTVTGGGEISIEEIEAESSESVASWDLGIDFSKDMTVRGKDLYAVTHVNPKTFEAFGIEWRIRRKKHVVWAVLVTYKRFDNPEITFYRPGSNMAFTDDDTASFEPRIRRAVLLHDRMNCVLDKEKHPALPPVLEEFDPADDFARAAIEAEEGLYRFRVPVKVIGEFYKERNIRAVCQDDYLYALNYIQHGDVFTKGQRIERVLLYRQETLKRLRENQQAHLDELDASCRRRHGELHYVDNETLEEPLRSYPHKDFALVKSGDHEAVIVTDGFVLQSPLQTDVRPPSAGVEGDEVIVLGYISTRPADVNFYRRIFEKLKASSGVPKELGGSGGSGDSGEGGPDGGNGDDSDPNEPDVELQAKGSGTGKKGDSGGSKPKRKQGKRKHGKK